MAWRLRSQECSKAHAYRDFGYTRLTMIPIR